jgi:nitrite reductase/ring-hydroxylating ferredoxin subunit
MQLIKVAEVGELDPGNAKVVEVAGEEVGLFFTEGRYYAIQNTCPHREAYLHEGALEGTHLTCPWHFAVFDIETGQVLEGPAEDCLKTYEVVVEGEEIKIAVPE